MKTQTFNMKMQDYWIYSLIVHSKSIVKYLSNFQEWEKKLRETLMEVPIKFYKEGYIENWT